MLRGLTPLMRLEVLPSLQSSRLVRVESCSAARFRGTHTMQDADWLDVVAHRVQDRTQSDLGIKAVNQRPQLSLHTQWNKSNRSGQSCLSKIAHIRSLRWHGLFRDWIKLTLLGVERFSLARRSRRQHSIGRNASAPRNIRTPAHNSGTPGTSAS
ncbi:hypothetical protein SBA7_1390009 [Candidatus Sulfotelmatobacter sp. SbA7]|nr:hypothetical protein SBA7_1390009 [Candidatus Sulfotelmatobacter sp. SbA7]